MFGGRDVEMNSRDGGAVPPSGGKKARPLDEVDLFDDSDDDEGLLGSESIFQVNK